MQYPKMQTTIRKTMGVVSSSHDSEIDSNEVKQSTRCFGAEVPFFSGVPSRNSEYPIGWDFGF